MQLTVFCCGDFDLFFRSVLRQDPISSTLYFGGEGLQACIAWGVPPADVLSAVARSRCKQQVIFAVFKALCGDSVCKYPFFLLPFQCVFQAPVATNNRMKKTTRELFDVFLFFLCRLVSSCPSIVLPIIFLDMN